MHRAPNSSNQSEARSRLQIRHHDLSHHSQLLLSAVRRTVLTSTEQPQHHRGLLAEDQDLNRKLPNEAEEDRLL